MELTEEQMGFVQARAESVGLMMSYYSKFGEDAFDVAKNYYAQAGKMLGEDLKRSMKIEGNDANAVAAALNAFLAQVAGMAEAAKVEGNQVICENEGFCSVMEAVKMLNAPWEKICANCSWPMFEGVARGINPDATMDVEQSRIWGDTCCKHVITVPE
ncbi:MAG TPA: hypothetical protein VMW67_05880 [Desulfobacteria bacterium]|nr:hypothetical protein [Desulfobacteria bacterium]